MPDDVTPRKRLIDYLPPFMQDFAEIKAIMHTENPELDRAWHDIQMPLADAFILDCDEYSIKKYETFVGITSNPEDTLDSRKARVLIWWNNFIPYTYRVLVRRLNSLCGTGNYEIYGNLEDYELFIATHLMFSGQVESLEHLLEQIVPMNMNFGSENEFICTINGLMGCAGGVCTIEKITITSDFEESWDLGGTSMSRGIIDNIEALRITSDFEENCKLNGTSVSHGAIDIVEILQISNDIKETAETDGNEKAAAFAVYATRNIPEPVTGTVFIDIRTS